MSQEWMSYPFTWRLPLSGDVVQNIYPTAEFNYAGVLSIERDVVENVASFGTQLGILSDAVLELAGTANGPKVQRLRDLAKRIEDLKNERKEDVRQAAVDALERLRKVNVAAYRELLGAKEP